MPEVIGLGQLRSAACTYLERVAAGETIDVVRRGRLLAQIVSAGDSTVASNPADAAGPIELDELRARTGRYLDRAAAGDEIEIVRGGRVVARIVSAVGDSARTA
jgi:prevent-host-death family protein